MLGLKVVKVRFMIEIQIASFQITYFLNVKYFFTHLAPTLIMDQALFEALYNIIFKKMFKKLRSWNF